MHLQKPDADFAIMNPGGFRTVWLPGVLEYQHVYGMSPFTNELQSFKINGSELKQMLKIIQEGKKGFYNTFNLQTTVNVHQDEKNNTIKDYVIGTFYNLTEIEDEK